MIIYPGVGEGFHAPTSKKVPLDACEAVRLYQLSADQGFAGAQSALGRIYFEGTGVARDVAGAVEMWRRAAAQGDGMAQSSLGYLLFTGEGVPKDQHEAARLWPRLNSRVLIEDSTLRVGEWVRLVSGCRR